LKAHVEVLDKVTDRKRTFIKPIGDRVDGQARLPINFQTPPLGVYQFVGEGDERMEIFFKAEMEF
jgi:hypothetical protein